MQLSTTNTDLIVLPQIEGLPSCSLEGKSAEELLAFANERRKALKRMRPARQNYVRRFAPVRSEEPEKPVIAIAPPETIEEEQPPTVERIDDYCFNQFSGRGGIADLFQAYEQTKAESGHTMPKDVFNAVKALQRAKPIKKQKKLNCDDIAKKVVMWAHIRGVGISINELKGSQKPNRLVRWRHLTFSLCARYTDKSLPEIGRYFNRDHTTILHGRDKHLARQAEKRAARKANAELFVDEILERVCWLYGISPKMLGNSMLGQRGDQAKRVAIFLACQRTNLPRYAISDKFGGHTKLATHSFRRVTEQRAKRHAARDKLKGWVNHAKA